MPLASYLKTHTNPPVFVASGSVALAVVLWGVLAPASLSAAADATLSVIAADFGWWYVFLVTALLVAVLWIAFSPYGRIELGKDAETPEWGSWAWFSMLFTAGMGLGLVYYGVSEPLAHFTAPPVGEAGTPEAALRAIELTFFHWCLPPWAVYVVVGLAMAYFHFRHDLPPRPASALYPLIGSGWGAT